MISREEMGQCSLPLIVIYDHPTDFPNHFVALLWDWETATEHHEIAESVYELRNKLPLSRMVLLGRSKRDDPNIVEVWI